MVADNRALADGDLFKDRFAYSFGSGRADGQAVKIAVDGAWRSSTLVGVAACCVEDSSSVRVMSGYTRVHALSSTGVEAFGDFAGSEVG